MGVLSSLEPVKVFGFFEDICGIPHGSGNIEQISNYIVDFAVKRNLKYRQDEMKNVIIWKDGSAGYKDSEPVILQGHIDMVAVKVADSDKDLEKDGLDLEIDGDWITAKGTSLGGDNGIAVAYALAVLDDDSLAHPPIEAIFTVDEEIGLLGAGGIDVSDLKGKMFLNMDSEDEGVFTVSCAGGSTTTCKIPRNTEPIDAAVIEFRLDGFAGGHSGVEIHKGRVNTNCAMGRILLNLFQNLGVRLITINGGEKDNAIAKMSEAAVAVLPESVEKAKQIITDTFNEIKEEHKATDPNANLTINELAPTMLDVFTGPSTLATIIALVNMPNGIQRMNPEIEGLVQTSLNLGVLRTEMDHVKLSYAVRSSNDSEKKFLNEKLRSLTEIFGGTIDVAGVYPGWKYKADSKLRDVMVGVYKDLYGNEPVVEGIHAGLECGMFAEKIAELDAVSFGPQMKDVHTTDERLSISSTKRTWDLVVKTLEALK